MRDPHPSQLDASVAWYVDMVQRRMIPQNLSSDMRTYSWAYHHTAIDVTSDESLECHEYTLLDFWDDPLTTAFILAPRQKLFC